MNRLPFKKTAISGLLVVALAAAEVFRGVAYKPTPDDVWTVGYGSTEGVKHGDTITPERALLRLYSEADQKYAKGLEKCVTGLVSQSEKDSLVFGAYNMGVSGQCKSPMVKAINEGRYSEACDANLSYRITVKGKDCRIRKNQCFGLIDRRLQESKMCKGEYHAK